MKGKGGMARVYLAGTGAFGLAVAESLSESGHEVVGVTAPTTGRRGGWDLLAAWADRLGVPRREDLLRPHVPAATDLIMAAHSHAYVGKKTRGAVRESIGYHPSLLPLHRGRDAVKWQARMGERVSGGSVYHLADRVDGGPLVSQRHVVIPRGIAASDLWREYLFPLGVEMLVEAATLSDSGPLPRVPQREDLATWEPSLDSAPLYRPELPELE